ILLGRPAAALRSDRHNRVRQGPALARSRRRQVLVERSRLLGGAAPRARIEHAVDDHPAFERDREHVTGFDLLGRQVDLVPVETYSACLDNLRRKRPRLDHAGEEQPLVDALATLARHLLLELVAKRSKLGEGRIRIDPRRPLLARLGTVVAAVGTALALGGGLALELLASVEAPAPFLAALATLAVLAALTPALRRAAVLPMALAVTGAALVTGRPPQQDRLGLFLRRPGIGRSRLHGRGRGGFRRLVLMRGVGGRYSCSRRVFPLLRRSGLLGFGPVRHGGFAGRGFFGGFNGFH